MSYFFFLYPSLSLSLSTVSDSVSSNIDQVLSINPLLFLSLETLTSIMRTGLPILVELINLVNSAIIFLPPMTLLTWVTFLLGSQTVILTVLLFWIFFLGASTFSRMAFTVLGNSDYVVISVSIDFPSHSQQDASFYHIAYDYSCAYWDSLYDHFRDIPCKNTFKLLVLLVNFVSGFRLELTYISLIENIMSILTHLQSFHLLLLLP